MEWDGSDIPPRATLADVARQAGVSLATADRALNGRAGVRAITRARIDAAVARLGYRAHPAAALLARNHSLRFVFLLPANANSFMASLEAGVRDAAPALAPQAFIDIRLVDVFDPVALAVVLETLPAQYDAVALVALDHPRVRAAIDALAARGTQVVTLVSDAPTSRRFHYVGIDNPAAGRTAGSLMGRFLGGRAGQIGIIAGSLALRDHAERHFGFNQVLAGEYRPLCVLPVREGLDDPAQNYAHAMALLTAHPDLVGLYNVGAGNEGIARALAETGRSLVWIAHELSAETRRLLLCDIVAAVIDQNAGHEARSAARVMLARCTGAPINPDQELIRIEIYLRDNLP